MIWPGLTKDVEQGLFMLAESDPWVMVSVDLVGPFTIRTPAKTHSLLALTMIDPAIKNWLV
jgi:hypothetical protein